MIRLSSLQSSNGRGNKSASFLTLLRTCLIWVCVLVIYYTSLHYIWLLLHIEWQIFFSDEDDDDDDTEALMAELERIKKERAEEKLRKVSLSLHIYRESMFSR